LTLTSSLHVPSIYTLVGLLGTPQYQTSKQQSSPRPTFLFLSMSAISPIASSPLLFPLRLQCRHHCPTPRNNLIICSASASLLHPSRITRFP
jgi:hypothetical protein